MKIELSIDLRDEIKTLRKEDDVQKAMTQAQTLLNFYNSGIAAVSQAENIIKTFELQADISKFYNFFNEAITDVTKIKEAKINKSLDENNPWHVPQSKIIPEKNDEKKFSKKAILQYTLEGEFVAEYPSVTEAIKATGFSFYGISSCAKGKIESFKNFVFKFKN